MLNFIKNNINLFIIIISGLFFIPFLGSVHLFDWDEINFAEAAREMIVTGDYFHVQIDFQPFWEKPPLFIWFQVISMKIFGINEFAARLPNALCGIITLLLINHIGTKVFDKKFGVLWTLTFLGSFLPFFYFKSGIIDPLFNLFIFLGIYFFYRLVVYRTIHRTRKKQTGNLLLSGLFIGLAILTKGPVGLLIPAFCIIIYWIIHWFKSPVSFKDVIIFSFTVLLISFLWYGIEIINNGIWFMKEFILYQVRLFTTQDAGHGGPFYYHFIVLLIGCFPASVFVLEGLKRRRRDNRRQYTFRQLMIILLCVVLFTFSVVSTKIIHYSSLCYFPITFLCTYYIHSLLYRGNRWKSYLHIMLIIIGGMISFLLIALPLIGLNIKAITPYLVDVFNIKDTFMLAGLQAKVHWTGWETVGGVIYVIAIASSIILFIKKRYLLGYGMLFFSTAIVVLLTLKLIAPKIEGYSQRTAVNFYKSLQNKNCYVEVLGFKSYAHLFYAHKKPMIPALPEGTDETAWLLYGNIDKPAYFVSKKTIAKEYYKIPQLKLLKEQNGFVFFKRDIREKYK